MKNVVFSSSGCGQMCVNCLCLCFYVLNTCAFYERYDAVHCSVWAGVVRCVLTAAAWPGGWRRCRSNMEQPFKTQPVRGTWDQVRGYIRKRTVKKSQTVTRGLAKVSVQHPQVVTQPFKSQPASKSKSCMYMQNIPCQKYWSNFFLHDHLHSAGALTLHIYLVSSLISHSICRVLIVL